MEKKKLLDRLDPLSERILCIRDRLISMEIKKKEQNQFEQLYVGQDAQAVGRREQRKRISLCIVLLFSCLFLIVVYRLQTGGKPAFLQEGAITRPVGETQEEKISLSWEGSTREEEEEALLSGEALLTIREQQLTGEELEQLFLDAEETVKELLCGENTSMLAIRGDIAFPETVPGTRITVSCTPENYEWLNPDGSRTGKEVPEAGVPLRIRIELTYYEETRSFEQIVQLLPEGDSEERFIQHLQNYMKALENDTKSSMLRLPSELNGMFLTWRETREDNSLLLLFLGGIAIFCVLMSGKSGREKQIERREKQLLTDYPELVSKYMLFLNAGLTIRGAWERICRDAEGNDQEHYLYREMLITKRELENGISESRAYEQFGRRCRLLPYLRFSAVLVQNLMKGARGTLPLLEQEARTAFSERKEAAKRLGEEAGTKLLLPMAGLLCIIVGMILIPAFQGI